MVDNHDMTTPTNDDIRFTRWMMRVDGIIDDMTGLSSQDIGDAPYRDNFDAGTTELEMVRIALIDWNDMSLAEFEALRTQD